MVVLSRLVMFAATKKSIDRGFHRVEQKALPSQIGQKI